MSYDTSGLKSLFGHLTSEKMEKFTNSLITESSPYLLQHAHNPVNWVPWSDDLFEKAQKENKMVLISIGYSACHWCHVMEHECFENEEVAELMNKYFINVKVDREERPDVDQIYMTAVQLMTQKGGWPLNCFTLPDGRPIYGGTYFPKEIWMNILRSLDQTYKQDKEKALNYAAQLHEGIQKSELIDVPEEIKKFDEEKLHELVLRWSRNFDRMEGGDSRAPKFPLPSNYQFLLQYGVKYENVKVLSHVELSLDKMAFGGIYDQVGGGFARYSVDMLWKVPHFEKMLYDNAQLISLYSFAYSYFKKPLYKRIVFQTIEWLEREMLTNEGACYSALDADSEGEEGKFYCWTKEDIENCLQSDADWAKEFYSINQKGYWEEGKYILLRSFDDKQFSSKMKWSQEDLESKIAEINQKLLDERSHRVRPGTDDKTLTSWNAMMIKGLCDASAVFENEEFKHLAIKIAKWLIRSQITEEGTLLRTYKYPSSKIEGFLEDYCHTINAFLSLYRLTFEVSWLEKADKLMQICFKDFQNKESKMFYFTAESSNLIARKMELNDNVIPSSNSVMANNLLVLGNLLSKNEYIDQAQQMISNVYEGMEMYGSGYSNWASALLHNVENYYVVAISGDNIPEYRDSLLKEYLPNSIFCGGNNNELEILKGKNVKDGTQIFICSEGNCLVPTNDLNEAIKVLKS